ncbi:MAG: PEP-CTERM sorting domain-containing protein [Planctomycetota bacterium]
MAFAYSTCLQAQSDFFFSFERAGDNSDQSGVFNVGDSGSLWIYWSTNGPNDSDLDVGGFLDISTTNSGVIEFVQAQTFDYDILVNGNIDIGNRWTNDTGGGGSVGFTAASITSDFIDDLHAFTLMEAGIIEFYNGSGPFLDAGYFPVNDAFEFGRIDFNVIGTGETSVTGQAGSGGIVNGASTVPAFFSTATITAQSIPEPTSALLIAVGLVWCQLVRSRRKKL